MPSTDQTKGRTVHDAIIEAEDLVKAFGSIRALDGLTLTVQRGSIHALLGPNGAGKTTLIRILTTLLPPDTGTARVAGVDVRTDPAGVRAQIGLAGQSAAVDDYLTGRENVEMVGRLYGLSRGQAQRGAREMLERIGLSYACRTLTAAGRCSCCRTPSRPQPSMSITVRWCSRHRTAPGP